LIREHLFHKRAAADPLFRWRGGEVSRLEAFSDAVFALTLTLLVASTTAPKTFHQLWLTFRDIPVFIVTFATLMMAWQYHYSFFRRYGLQDFGTTVLNAIFLFLIVFLAYPLKFLATFLWYLIIGGDVDAMFVMPMGVEFPGGEPGQREWMMIIYGLGLLGVFGMFALLQWRAWSKRKELELDELERYMTMSGLGHHLITVVVAILSLTMIWSGGQPGVAGVVYFLLPFSHCGWGWRRGVGAQRMHKQMSEA